MQEERGYSERYATRRASWWRQVNSFDDADLECVLQGLCWPWKLSVAAAEAWFLETAGERLT